MNGFTFTDAHKIRWIKLSWFWFSVSAIASTLSHIGFDDPIVQITTNALNIVQSNLAVSAWLHAGLVSIFLSIAASNYGFKEHVAILGFAGVSLSVGLGALFGFMGIALCQSDNLSHIFAGFVSYLLVLFKFWLVPNLFKHWHDKWRKFHSTLDTFALLVAISVLILSVYDMLNGNFPSYNAAY